MNLLFFYNGLQLRSARVFNFRLVMPTWYANNQRLGPNFLGKNAVGFYSHVKNYYIIMYIKTRQGANPY